MSCNHSSIRRTSVLRSLRISSVNPKQGKRWILLLNFIKRNNNNTVMKMTRRRKMQSIAIGLFLKTGKNSVKSWSLPTNSIMMQWREHNSKKSRSPRRTSMSQSLRRRKTRQWPCSMWSNVEQSTIRKPTMAWSNNWGSRNMMDVNVNWKL